MFSHKNDFLIHIYNSRYEIYELNPLRPERSFQCLKNLEEAKICNVLFHSGPQIILQSVILLRMNDFSNSYWQIASIGKKYALKI